MAKRKKRNVRVQKKTNFPRVANMLVNISLFLLVLNAMIVILFKDSVLEALKQTGVEATASSLVLLGILWLMISFFAWSINKSIKEIRGRPQMWELLILSVITFFSGRMESGVLLLIASIVYLAKTRKK